MELKSSSHVYKSFPQDHVLNHKSSHAFLKDLFQYYFPYISVSSKRSALLKFTNLHCNWFRV